jgi:hypothetical protein
MTRSGARGAPVVVVGMHRSGTAIVARILEALGVDLGGGVSPDAEDVGIVRLHELLLRRAGGSWEYPQPFVDLVGLPHLRLQAEQRLRRYASRQRPRSQVWGWKDPRTAFTLPLWESIYGDLSLVVVRRDGRDVAASLAHRARAEQQRANGVLTERRRRRRVLDAIDPARAVRFDSVRCWEPDKGLQLWAEYNHAIDSYVERTRAPTVELRLEDLVRGADEQIRRLAEALGASATLARHALDTISIRQPVSRPELHPSGHAVEAVSAMLSRYGYIDALV